MISSYKVFEPNYSTYKRTKLKLLFKELEKDSKCFNSFNNSIEVIRFLESKSPELIKLEAISQLDLNIEVAKGIDKFLEVYKKSPD